MRKDIRARRYGSVAGKAQLGGRLIWGGQGHLDGSIMSPSFVLDPSRSPSVLDILVGRCINVYSASAFPIRGFVLDLFSVKL
jgi:hypothetical protein